MSDDMPAKKFELTSQEKFLLEWLSKEDSSAYGECYGKSLNVLIAQGLAQTSETPPSDWARVSLTEAGFALAAEIRAAHAVGESQ